MIIRQGFSFKLKPDGAQDKKMSRFAGCTRWVYNQGLAWNEERRTADPAFHLSYAKLCTELLVWKEQNPWLRETHSQVLQQSLKDLMGGFQKFFKGLTAFPKKHKKFGPRTPSASRRASRLMKDGGRFICRASAGSNTSEAASFKARPRT